uniref:Uncharacterized protein n=1 Tax=Equus asinus asinus TaxID=83772 RepID=A0A8C4PF44_EQUAS
MEWEKFSTERSLLRGPCELNSGSEMETSGSSSTISEQQLWSQEGLSNATTDLAEQSLISSEEWLQLHGLKSNKLTLKQILSQIGFPHCEGIVLDEDYFRLVAFKNCRWEGGSEEWNLLAICWETFTFIREISIGRGVSFSAP